MQADTLDGGFADPATDAAHAFRAVMEADATPQSVLISAHIRKAPSPADTSYPCIVV